jgi:uncharacterized protein GlcG (DUF336 family)
MRNLVLKSAVICSTVLFGTPAFAQGGPPPYGPPITFEQANKAIAAAAAEAKKNNWFLAISVMAPGGYLVGFGLMDQTQVGSIAISQHKARAAVNFRRPTKAFQDQLTQEKPNLVIMTLDDVIASEGGIPIVADGKVIGAIGCSGATGAQDGQACQAGVNALK